MPDKSQTVLNRLSKYPLIKAACEQRWENAPSDIVTAQSLICDAMTSVLKDSSGKDADRIASAINHLAMAHVFLEAIKKSGNGKFP